MKRRVERVFLDANVLFSAAYKADSLLSVLWTFSDTVLLTSAYALQEAVRNIEMHRLDALPRLKAYADRCTFVEEASAAVLPKTVTLHHKDIPILAAAIGGKADFLLTGDKQHFGALIGKNVRGVTVLYPALYIQQRRSI